MSFEIPTSSTQMHLVTCASRILNRFGYTIENKGRAYLNPDQIVREARNRDLSVCEYLERFNIAGIGRRRDAIISSLQQ